MKRNIVITLIGLFFVCFLNSCDISRNNQTLETQNITEDITTNTVWKGNKVYLIKNNDLQIYSTLTIEAGAIIKFHTKNGNITVRHGGRIIAEGTALSPIVFTSFRDDNNGGDSDGIVSNPSQGDWGTIALVESTGSIFEYCEFNYGGFSDGSSYTSTLDIWNSDAEINYCTFSQNGGGFDGNYFTGALNAKDALPSTKITNTKFKNNHLPLTIYGEMNIDNSNSFSYNIMNAIFVGGFYVNKNTIWQENEVAFVITSTNFTVSNNSTLTLGPGVILKFLNDGMMNLLDGEAALINHGASGVFFTSFKDDYHGGDSNGNGGADLNSLNSFYYDWNGIYTGGQKNTNYATWENILYTNPNPPLVK